MYSYCNTAEQNLGDILYKSKYLCQSYNNYPDIKFASLKIECVIDSGSLVLNFS